MDNQTENYPTACAHIHVERFQIEKGGRVFEEQWRCKDCGTKFVALDGLFGLPGKITVMGPVKTLRDEFAMAVLPKMIEKADEYSDAVSSIMRPRTTEELESYSQTVLENRLTLAHICYKWADAMLEARK